MTATATHLANDVLKAIAGGWGYLDAAAKLAGHPERLALFLAGREQEITPVNIEIWPSLRCNARCPKCPYRTNDARHEADRRNANTRLISLQTLIETGLARQDVMPIERWAKMAREFRQAGGLSVTFTGGGEPTEHPDLPDFGRIARQEGLVWGLYTNGYNLTPAIVDQLLANSPDFIRISINSWSAQSHDQVYHLGGDAYNRVRQNVTYLSQHAPTSVTVGVGYVVDHATDRELHGVSEFICSIAQQGRLDYVAVRPEILYYSNDGTPREVQPRCERYAVVPETWRKIVGPVCAMHGVSLQINDAGFNTVADGIHPSTCMATQWATSATESGRLYLLSEANGSSVPKLAELCYGDISGDTHFLDAWNSRHRQKISDDFTDGTRLAPVWHKLTGLDLALKRLRSTYGIVHSSVAEEVAELLNARPKPRHWRFI